MDVYSELFSDDQENQEFLLTTMTKNSKLIASFIEASKSFYGALVPSKIIIFFFFATNITAMN